MFKLIICDQKWPFFCWLLTEAVGCRWDQVLGYGYVVLTNTEKMFLFIIESKIYWGALLKPNVLMIQAEKVLPDAWKSIILIVFFSEKGNK